MYRLSSFFLLGFVFLVLQAGCAGPRAKYTPTPAELAQLDQDQGRKIATTLESAIKIKPVNPENLEVLVYLRRLGLRLLNETPGIKDTTLSVSLCDDPSGKWRNYSLPGVRLYLATSFLKKIEFENVLAAAISIQLGHVTKRHVMKTVERDSANEIKNPGDLAEIPENLDLFGPNGLFSYTEQDEFEAIDVAVGTLYRAGYDPRGMIMMFNLFQRNLKAGGYSLTEVTRMIERTHRAIVAYSPLLNPVVRSDDFVDIQKRILRL